MTGAPGIRMGMRKVIVGLSIAAVLLGACGGSEGGTSVADPKVCSTDKPITGPDLDGLPEGLPLEEWGVIVRVDKSKGFIGAKAIGDTQIVELYPEITRAIQTNGYKQISGENEGFEAEVFFQKGSDTGTFLLRKGPCEGQVTITLIYGSTPAAQASPSMNAGGGGN
jgi:hypothetical protein